MKRLYTSAVAAELGDLPGTPAGIGLCDALLGTAALIARERPSHLVFVGTAGVYCGGVARPGGPRGSIGSAVNVHTAVLVDTALALGLGYSPRHPGPLVTPWPAGAAATALTSLAITTDPALAARLRDAQTAGMVVENMEAYGFALACERAGVAWAICLGITNAVGPGAHAEWLANRGAAEAAARSLARGL